MSKPIHTLIAYFDDGEILRRPWRVQEARSVGIRRDGPATDEQLALWADHTFLVGDTGTRTHVVERAVITRPHQLQGKSWGWTDVVIATYLRSTQPTEDQTRLIERIGSAPNVARIHCDPLKDGNITVRIERVANLGRSETVVYRHPTVKELIYGDK